MYDIEKLIEDYSIYRKIVISIDLATIGIFLCIFIVLLLQLNKNNKKIRNCFIIHILVMVLTLCIEICGWSTMFKPEYVKLYEIITTLNFFSTWIIPPTIFLLIISILEYKVTFNKKFLTIYLLSYVILGSLLFIPPFRDLIINFNYDIVGYSTGPLTFWYYIIDCILTLLGLAIGIAKAKKIGIRDTIVISVFIIVSAATTFIDKWWASTIGLLFMGFSLIILFGITYEKRLIVEREKRKEQQIELSETKMTLLMTQIQPHFLYNTLTTLKYLCETSPTDASELCDTFSSYLRSNIDAVNDNGLVLFEKELSNIINYLKIEKARFGNRVNYEFHINEKDFLIPVLSIQAIVENAVKRGICQRIKGGTIIIETKNLDDNNVEIKVIDDGVGFDLEKIKNDGKNHVGMKNTTERIKMIGGTIDINSIVGTGTTVTLVVPKGEE